MINITGTFSAKEGDFEIRFTTLHSNDIQIWLTDDANAHKKLYFTYNDNWEVWGKLADPLHSFGTTNRISAALSHAIYHSLVHCGGEFVDYTYLPVLLNLAPSVIPYLDDF